MDGEATFAEIGQWLKDNKGCQDKDFFEGYTIGVEVPSGDNGDRIDVDVVGVRFDRREIEAAGFDFTFFPVCMAGPDESIESLTGRLDLLGLVFEDGTVLGADYVAPYAAVQSLEVPDPIRAWAEENSVGILGVESTSGQIAVHELLSAPTRDVYEPRPLSKRDQRSPGNFSDAVGKCPVLGRVLSPESFYDAKIRPIQEENERKRAWDANFRKIKHESAEDALRELVSELTTLDDFEVCPHRPETPRFFVGMEGSESSLTVVPQNRNFKIETEESDLLFRIAGREEVEDFTGNDIRDLDGVIQHLRSECFNG